MSELNEARGEATLSGIHLDPMTPEHAGEWDHAWAALVARTGDADMIAEDRASGEVWQYMGTYRNAAGAWVHQFRHRCHPRTGARWYLDVPPSARFAERHGGAPVDPVRPERETHPRCNCGARIPMDCGDYCDDCAADAAADDAIERAIAAKHGVTL